MTSLNAPKLQIWNNAAFDDAIEASWSNLPPNESFDCSKENQISPRSCGEAKSNIIKAKSGADGDIDAEIEQVEKEIGRLSTRLESLRLEKAARSIAIRGRIVPAKFMESSQKHTVKFDPGSKSTTTRRGLSLGPGEIFSKSETLTRRKSCFFKLPGIDQRKSTKPRGRTSLSLSPRSRKTVGSKRAVKKEEGVLSSIQPKRLFKEEERNVASRKPGRVVASRYSLVAKTQTGESKRSLPDNQGKENHRSDKRRASDENCSKSEGRVKKRWEIPSQVDVYISDETPVGKELPKIRTLRRAGDSPRDSGAAKRVAELQGNDRKFAFCQLLRFEE
ncbi:hypothetical protein AALP_AA7G122100 [Arabis alpina]|uniref:Uncharacterized protein n=1 Tax=Arabis alpina TaxID=50452 RepID=A0A087GHJ6_ARAAL|nr:hypothetical protein AALP_AA7G122100 [Arabis alpina]